MDVFDELVTYELKRIERNDVIRKVEKTKTPGMRKIARLESLLTVKHHAARQVEGQSILKLKNAALQNDQNKIGKEIIRGNYDFKFPKKAVGYGEKVKLIASQKSAF